MIQKIPLYFQINDFPPQSVALESSKSWSSLPSFICCGLCGHTPETTLSETLRLLGIGSGVGFKQTDRFSPITFRSSHLLKPLCWAWPLTTGVQASLCLSWSQLELLKGHLSNLPPWVALSSGFLSPSFCGRVSLTSWREAVLQLFCGSVPHNNSLTKWYQIKLFLTIMAGVALDFPSLSYCEEVILWVNL